jgi:hypothetical protein
MKRLAKFATPWWLGGVALAALGVIVVRVASPAIASAVQPAAKLAGELLALAGLLVIARGLNRRGRGAPSG